MSSQLTISRNYANDLQGKYRNSPDSSKLLTFQKRFTEKSAHEWRQIYKALQLLEYLVKNGSERVVDYARSHIAVIEMLKNFHYINTEGKDQGINVRNRSKELLVLLNDVSKIRAERKTSKAKRSKYSGTGSTQSGGFGGSGKKYGGFGSDTGSSDFGAYSGGVYGDGGGFGGSEYEGPGYSRSSRSHANEEDDFEEYEVAPSAPSSSSKKSSQAPLPQRPQADLFSFDDSAASTSSNPPLANATDEEEDDFADFQSAASPQTTVVPPNISKPLPATQSDNIFDLFSSAPSSTFQSTASSSNSTLPSFGNNSNQSVSYSFGSTPVGTSSTTLSGASSTVFSNGSKPKKDTKNDAFGDLWSSAASKKSSKPVASSPSVKDNGPSLI